LWPWLQHGSCGRLLFGTVQQTDDLFNAPDNFFEKAFVSRVKRRIDMRIVRFWRST
jgi:hypothetical protein